MCYYAPVACGYAHGRLKSIFECKRNRDFFTYRMQVYFFPAPQKKDLAENYR
jgi:hypothetical protein